MNQNNIISNMIISIILTSIKSGDNATLESLGLTSDSLSLLKEIDFNDLINSSHKILNISIDEKELSKIIQSNKVANDYNLFIKEAITLGATREIMHKFTSLSHADFRKIRSELNMTSKRSGSVLSIFDSEKLDQEIIDCIKANKNKIKININLLVDLSKKTSLPINSIYNHIIEYWDNKFII